MKRVISTQLQEEDIKIEKSLRPMYFDDYIGQQKIKDNLKIYIEAAKSSGVVGKTRKQDKLIVVIGT